jgi:hypothetical protein
VTHFHREVAVFIFSGRDSGQRRRGREAWKHQRAIVDVTQNVYNRTWWEERVEAVSIWLPQQCGARSWRNLCRQRGM